MSFKITAESDLWESRGTFTLDMIKNYHFRCVVIICLLSRPLVASKFQEGLCINFENVTPEYKRFSHISTKGSPGLGDSLDSGAHLDSERLSNKIQIQISRPAETGRKRSP
jgi:hypothetical protein